MAGRADEQQHYLSCAVQPIEVMMLTLSPDEFRGFLKGNIIKYTQRAGRKGDAAIDEEKAQQYRQWLREFNLRGRITIPSNDDKTMPKSKS